jgi:AGCS family alanine or glycine:cation symporter
MQALEAALSAINDLVWGPPMLALLFGTHIYLTVRLGFIQRYTVRAIRISLEHDKEAEGDVSQFGAVTTALAATIGTGNIVGVATAVALGGPGAVFWMWLSGVFGIATKYAEALLSVKYRVRTDQGMMAGGPMYVLERALGYRRLAVAFAFLTAVAAFGIGNMVQANSIASLARTSFGMPLWLTGVMLTCLTALVIVRGIHSIASVSQRLVPFMAVFYVLGCLILLGNHAERIPDTIGLILRSAFDGHAAVGGFAGAGFAAALRFGIARGLFSNEAGLGSAAIVAAAAQTRNPVRQALVSSTGVFWDTVVVCAVTGVTLVNSGHWNQGLNGVDLTRAAFGDLPVLGPLLLNVGLLTFVFSTIIGWSYYGEKAVEYLFGPAVIRPYRWLWVAAVMLGSVASLPVVWSFADIANALMAIPNLIALLLLTRTIVAETRRDIGSA